ncbi:hypothetical protein CSKR_201408 [Clonorchis sinensis]|uniref:CUB domain-containing protein n=1 Tax=Clonorchis sinensis TaxID=79923 RepID=A0A8T1MR41_CLOSI|nr:hypothetical protein CSKR_201408 [Clonorchis sinensis]
MPQVRYCQARPKHKEVPIRWNNPCLKIRFVSNEVIVRRGFLAHYSFEISDSPRISPEVSMMVIALVLVLLGTSC